MLIAMSYPNTNTRERFGEAWRELELDLKERKRPKYKSQIKAIIEGLS